MRNQQYHNYFNQEEEVAAAAPAIAAAAIKARPGARLLDFYRSWRRARSSIVHFQLRNLLWATSGECLRACCEPQSMRDHLLPLCSTSLP